MNAEKNELHSLLADLVRINSVNCFYPDGPGEIALAEYIESYFQKRGIPTARQVAITSGEGTADRYNVLARLDVERSARTLVLEAHMDTVSVAGMSIDPFEPFVQFGKMFGRGACDTKGGLAAMMHAFQKVVLSQSRPPCNIIFAAVVDEEHSFRGVTRLCQGLHADGAIVAEPTELKVVTASKGVLRWKIRAVGIAAHSSKCHLGRNAIYDMAILILELEKQHHSLQAITAPLLGAASCNVGIVHGGTQVNFVPDECTIEIDRRLLPNEDTLAVLQAYQELLDGLMERHSGMKLVMEPPMLVDPAWAVDLDSSIVTTALQLSRIMKLQGEPQGVPFGSDASKLGRAGIPTIIFGPGSIDQAHAASEFVDLEQVEVASRFYEEMMLRFL